MQWSWREFSKDGQEINQLCLGILCDHVLTILIVERARVSVGFRWQSKMMPPDWEAVGEMNTFQQQS